MNNELGNIGLLWFRYIGNNYKHSYLHRNKSKEFSMKEICSAEIRIKFAMPTSILIKAIMFNSFRVPIHLTRCENLCDGWHGSHCSIPIIIKRRWGHRAAGLNCRSKTGTAILEVCTSWKWSSLCNLRLTIPLSWIHPVKKVVTFKAVWNKFIVKEVW